MKITPGKPGSQGQESPVREGGRKVLHDDFECVKTKSMEKYGVQDLSPVSGYGSHSY
jgi:hypothetical protein